MLEHDLTMQTLHLASIGNFNPLKEDFCYGIKGIPLYHFHFDRGILVINQAGNQKGSFSALQLRKHDLTLYDLFLKKSFPVFFCISTCFLITITDRPCSPYYLLLAFILKHGFYYLGIGYSICNIINSSLLSKVIFTIYHYEMIWGNLTGQHHVVVRRQFASLQDENGTGFIHKKWTVTNQCKYGRTWYTLVSY